MSKEFKTLNVQLANTCTLSKLKILVEICSIWDKSPDNDYKEELTITLDTICKVKS